MSLYCAGTSIHHHAGDLLLVRRAAVFIGRSFSAPLLSAVTILRRVAEQGDLNVTITDFILRRKDEIGDVGRGVQSIVHDYTTIESLAKHLAERDWRVDVQVKSDLDAMNKNLAQMLEQVDHALSEINGMSTGLQQLVAKFKLKE